MLLHRSDLNIFFPSDLNLFQQICFCKYVAKQICWNTEVWRKTITEVWSKLSNESLTYLRRCALSTSETRAYFLQICCNFLQFSVKFVIFCTDYFSEFREISQIFSKSLELILNYLKICKISFSEIQQKWLVGMPDLTPPPLRGQPAQ